LLELSSLHLPISGVYAAATSSPPSLALWHSRLGHAFVSRVQVLASKGLLGSMSNGSFDCISCQLGKQPTLPFNNESIAFASFDLIHSNVWGPSPVPSMSGSRYFVIFVDDFSCYTWVFLMNHVRNYWIFIAILQKWLRPNFQNVLKHFILIMP